jgi:hypothetical protein
VSSPSRLARWLARYGVAEVVGTGTAVAGAWVGALTGSPVAAAYGGAIGENVGYYGVIVLRDLLGARRDAHARDVAFGAREAALVGRDLALEFGPGELLDSLVTRPLLMGLGAYWLGGGVGIVAGKLAADLLFYSVVIGAHEARLHARGRVPRTGTRR